MKVKLQTYFIALCLSFICLSVPNIALAAKDTIKPSISGVSNKTINFGASFNALTGVASKDNADGNITKKIKVTGSVNTKKAGVYKLTYSVSDKAKNTTTVKRTITVKKDSIKPTISGASNLAIDLGSSFNSLSGITAKDNADGVITKKIKVTGSVNTKKAGVYHLTYSVSDNAKNTATVKRTITVKKDSVKPTIYGVSNTTIGLDSSFNPLSGVTAKDNVDGNITKKIKVIGSVNSKKTGVYTLSYTVSDQAGNKVSVQRIITVIDNVKPKLTNITNKKITLGESFDLLKDVSASDNYDGNITSAIKVTGSVNTKKAGNYVLTYTVSDQAGNSLSAKRTITVIDNVKPVILGIKNININIGENFDVLKGISASDNNDGNLNSAIKVTGSVDTNRAGSYILTYSVSDKGGNTVSTNRTIKVIDNIIPNIVGAYDTTIGLYASFSLLDGISAYDNNDGDITESIKISGTVNTNIEGDYSVTYKVTDAAGNTTTVNRTITVQKINVSNISITAPDTMKTGQTEQLTASIYPIDATDQNIFWYSSDDSIATIDENGLLRTLSEGTVTIYTTVDGMTTSKTITISDRPNLYLYKSGSSSINNVIKSLSISMYSYEPLQNAYVEKVEIYENDSLFTSYSAEALENAGISTTIAPYSSWRLSISFKLGIWANQSKVVVTVKSESGTSYQYILYV